MIKKKQQSKIDFERQSDYRRAFCIDCISKMNSANKRIVVTNVKRTNQNLCKPGMVLNVSLKQANPPPQKKKSFPRILGLLIFILLFSTKNRLYSAIHSL